MNLNVTQSIAKLIFRRAEVFLIDQLSPNFVLLSLRGKELRNRSWTPGDIVQISIQGLQARSYTPIAYDAETGRVDLIAFQNGQGRGSRWASEVEVGADCLLVGPRNALNLEKLKRPLIVFGDETSIGTSAAMDATLFGRDGVEFIYEANQPHELETVLKEFDLSLNAEVIARTRGDTHLLEIGAKIAASMIAEENLQLLCTGKSTSIVVLRNLLRKAGVSTNRIVNVPYWTHGRRAR